MGVVQHNGVMSTSDHASDVPPEQDSPEMPEVKPTPFKFAGLKIGKANTEGKPNMNTGGSSIGGGSLADRV